MHCLKTSRITLTKHMKVPFNDLTRIHEPIKKKVITKFSKIVDQNSFVLNKEISEFENLFSEFTNSNFSVGCSSGTDALELILRALEIGQGDEVLLPTNSFIATALAVTRCGAKPVFIDNDEFYLIDTDLIENKISSKTRAIIAVNLYGQLADLKKLSALSKRYGVYLIEDSAQSHGANNNEYKNAYSIAAAYSFYPGKNLGAWGDGGAVTTNNKKLYEKILLLRNWGSVVKYHHEELGFNSRLQPLQGVVLSEKIKKLSYWNDLRNEIANKYLSELSDISSISLPKIRKGNFHVWHLFVIRINRRDELMNHLRSNNIEYGIHYPIPIHRQNAYRNHTQFRKNFKRADLYSNKLLSLPIFPKMTKPEINAVISSLKSFK